MNIIFKQNKNRRPLHKRLCKVTIVLFRSYTLDITVKQIFPSSTLASYQHTVSLLRKIHLHIELDTQ